MRIETRKYYNMEAPFAPIFKVENCNYIWIFIGGDALRILYYFQEKNSENKLDAISLG